MKILNICILSISLLALACNPQPRSYTTKVVNKPVVQTVTTIKSTRIDGTTTYSKPKKVITTSPRLFFKSSRSYNRVSRKR